MSRPRKSIEAHKLDGTTPTYAVESEHKGALPKAPRCLSKDAKKKFRALARQLAERRTVTAGDAEILMLYADHYEQWLDARERVKAEGFRRKFTRLGSDGREVEVEKLNDALAIVEKSSRQMLSILTRLGLTPRDRELVTPTATSAKTKKDDGQEGIYL